MYWLISGSREFPDKKLAKAAMRALFKAGDIVVHGMAAGVDTWAFDVAKAKGITQKKFPADWQKHGKAAGIVRNEEMVNFILDRQRGGAVVRALIVWDGESNGTNHTKLLCEQHGIPMTLIQCNYD